jgi:hypothetical protein
VELQKNQNFDSLLWDAVSLPQKKTCSRGIQRREAMTPVCYLYSTAVIMHDTFISKTITFINSLLFNTRTTKTSLCFALRSTQQKFNWKRNSIFTQFFVFSNYILCFSNLLSLWYKCRVLNYNNRVLQLLNLDLFTC